MALRVERGADGVVTLTDTLTGRSERVETGRRDAQASTEVRPADELPAHMYGRLETGIGT